MSPPNIPLPPPPPKDAAEMNKVITAHKATTATSNGSASPSATSKVNVNPTKQANGSVQHTRKQSAKLKVNTIGKSVQSGPVDVTQSEFFKKMQVRNNANSEPDGRSSANNNEQPNNDEGLKKPPTPPKPVVPKQHDAKSGDDTSHEQPAKNDKSDDEEAKKLPIGDDPSQKQPETIVSRTPVKPEGSASPTTESAIASDTKSSISKITILKYSGVTFLLCVSVAYIALAAFHVIPIATAILVASAIVLPVSVTYLISSIVSAVRNREKVNPSEKGFVQPVQQPTQQPVQLQEEGVEDFKHKEQNDQTAGDVDNINGKSSQDNREKLPGSNKETDDEPLLPYPPTDNSIITNGSTDSIEPYTSLPPNDHDYTEVIHHDDDRSLLPPPPGGTMPPPPSFLPPTLPQGAGIPPPPPPAPAVPLQGRSQLRTPGKKASQVVNPVGSASVVDIAQEAMKKGLEMQKKREEKEKKRTPQPEAKKKEEKTAFHVAFDNFEQKYPSLQVGTEDEQLFSFTQDFSLLPYERSQAQLKENVAPPKRNEQVVEQPKTMPLKPGAQSAQFTINNGEAKSTQKELQKHFAQRRTAIDPDKKSVSLSGTGTVKGRPQARVIYKAQGSKSSSAPLVGIVAQHHTSGLVGTGVASNSTLVLT